MSLRDTRSKLLDAQRRVRQEWEVVRRSWKDAVAQDFEDEVWQSLDEATTAAIAAMDRLADRLDELPRILAEEEI